MNRPRYIYCLLLILAIAAFFRFYHIASTPPALYTDEAVNGINTLQVIEQGAIKVFYPENNGREGLFINIQAISVWLFGTEGWALRIVSGLFGVLTVLGLYLLAKELFKNHASPNYPTTNKPIILALISSFFLAVSFWHINFSRIGFRAITAPFWGVWAFYLILLSFSAIGGSAADRKKMRAGVSAKNYSLACPAKISKILCGVASGYWLSALGGLFFGLGFHSYISYRVMPALLLFVFIYEFFLAKKEAQLKNFFGVVIIISAAASLAILPLALHFYQTPQDFFGRTNEISIFKSPHPITDLIGNALKTIGMFNIAGDFNPRHNIPGYPELFWPIGILFIIGLYDAVKTFILTVYSYFKKKYLSHDEIHNFFIVCFVIIWLKIALLPVIISNEGLPHGLRSILAIPPVFILAGLGAVIFYDFFINILTKIKMGRPEKAAEAMAIGFCVALTISAYNLYFVKWAHDPRTADAFNKNYTDMAYQLKSLPLETKKYVVIPPGNMAINVIQFLTDTYTEKNQKEKNLFYLTPEQFGQTRTGSQDFIVRIK